MKLHKNLSEINPTTILSIFSLITCFSVVIWTLNVINTIKANDIAKAAKDELILRKLEDFSNIQTDILQKVGKIDNLASLKTELSGKLIEFPRMETGFSLLEDPLLFFLGVSFLLFTISAVHSHTASLERRAACSRLNEERNFLADERYQLDEQKALFTAAKIRYDTQFDILKDLATKIEVANEVDLNKSIKNIDENLQTISSSLAKVETTDASIQVDLSFSDFFG